MLRRSDSPENKHIDSTGHSRAKVVHTHRARDRDGGEMEVVVKKWVWRKISTFIFRCTQARDQGLVLSLINEL